jgi:hypothetical protein
MAGEAEKKRQKRNSEILLVLRIGTLVGLLLYAALRYFVFSWPSRWITFAFSVIVVLDLVLLYVLGSWAEQVDLTDAGLIEYMRDAIYFSWIVLFLALLSDWLFLSWFVLPIFAGYKLMGALPSAPSTQDEDDAKKKAPKKVSKLTKVLFKKKRKKLTN